MLSRRIFVALGLGGSLAAFAGFSTIVGNFLFYPRATHKPRMLKIGVVKDFPREERVAIKETSLWVFHDSGGLFAIQNFCPHLGCRPRWDEEDRCFICPCHGSVFNADGECIKGPASHRLPRVSLRLGQDGAIWADLQVKVGTDFRLKTG